MLNNNNSYNYSATNKAHIKPTLVTTQNNNIHMVESSPYTLIGNVKDHNAPKKIEEDFTKHNNCK